MIRAAVALSSYLGLTWVLLVVFCLLPGRALALVSPMAYSRVVAQAEWIAYQAATKASTSAAVAVAAEAASPASIAIRAVTGPVGWAALGVTVGLALYQTYYSDSQLNQIKTNTATPGGWEIPGYDPSPYTIESYEIHAGFGSTPIALLGGWNAGSLNCDPPAPGVPSGWNRSCYFNMGWGLTNGGSGAAATQNTGTPATAGAIQTYVNNLPDSDPLSIPSNSAPLGSNGPAPASAAQVQTVPVSPTDMPTTVKPTSQVSATDITVADNVPPPAGTQVSSPATQTTTKTTTTTENPDGSVTETEADTTTASCAIGDHDSRTLRSVYDQHSASWQNTGLLQAVTLLKTLTWPSTLPVVSLPSSFFGSQHIDFNDWAWVFTALRTLVIAMATLCAYRIVFVGGR